jgi:DNA mismatch endonuclease, patch repair protein
MPDIMNPAERSERMSRVRNKDSKPEKLVRSVLHCLGHRFRLHGKNLPGKPDIVLGRHKKIVFVHGCFWHRHGVCRRLSIPKSNPRFWMRKFADNVRRDSEKIAALRRCGWDVLIVWECETKDRAKLERTLRRFMAKIRRSSQTGASRRGSSLPR